VSCGYDLTGLRHGDRCPECGTTIAPRRPSKRSQDNLTDAPMDYLRTLRRACLMMGVGAFGSIVGPALTLWRFDAGQSFTLGMELLWLAGVFIATRPRRSAVVPAEETRAERRVLRPVVRASQSCWALYTVAEWAAHSGGGGGVAVMIFDVASWVLGMAAAFGLVPLAVLLTDLADWSHNDDLNGKLWFSAWSITVGGGVVVLSPFLFMMSEPMSLAGFVAIGRFFAVVLLVVGYLVFLAALIELANTAQWAIRNAHRLQARHQRAAERVAAATTAPPPEGPDEPMELKSAAMPARSQADQLPERSARQGARGRADEPRFEPGEELDPYELEP